MREPFRLTVVPSMRRFACTHALRAAIISAREAKRDAFDAITAVLPWDRFRDTVAEAESLARSEEFDAYQMLGEHYAGVRRWSPAFLATFTFQGVPAVASLLRAIVMLRAMNDTSAPACRDLHRPVLSGSAGHDMCCQAEELTGAITNFACCRNCAIGCVQGMYGS